MKIPEDILEELLDTVEWCFVLNEDTSHIIYANHAFLKECGPEILTQPYQEALKDRPLARLFMEKPENCALLVWELALQETNSYLMVRSRWFKREGVSYQIGIVSSSSDVAGLSKELSQMTLEYRRLAEENDRLLSDLHWNAYHDRLTGLGNRNKYIENCQKIFQKEQGLGVINIDINNLKALNDTWGHECGDEAICVVADVLTELLEPEKTYCYRMGGDEFLLVRRECTKEKLMEYSRYIAEAIPNKRICKGAVVCHAAIGCALQEEGESLNDLLKRGDENMYEDKRKKRSM